MLPIANRESPCARSAEISAAEGRGSSAGVVEPGVVTGNVVFGLAAEATSAVVAAGPGGGSKRAMGSIAVDIGAPGGEIALTISPPDGNIVLPAPVEKRAASGVGAVWIGRMDVVASFSLAGNTSSNAVPPTIARITPPASQRRALDDRN